MADQWDRIDGYLALSDLADQARLDADDRAAGADASVTRPPSAPAPASNPSPPSDESDEKPERRPGPARAFANAPRVPAVGGVTVARLANLPRPGGIGMLVFALVVFLFLIVPVNGTKTRMELIWLVITGAYKLPSAADVSAQEDALAADAAATGFLSGVQNTTGLPATQLLPPITPNNAYGVGAALSGGFNTVLLGTLA